MNNVILHEDAISRLLEGENGPVGEFVADLAAKITLEAQRNVANYFASAISLTVDQDVAFSMDGSTAVVGIRDAGSKSRRLAQGQAEGRINWLLDAVEAART